MKNKISDERLKMVIDELGEEYKDLLISNILENTGESDSKSINIPDLIRLDAAVKKDLMTDVKTRERKRLLNLAKVFATLYLLFGIFILIVNGIAKKSILWIEISLVLIAVGIVVLSAVSISSMIDFRIILKKGWDKKGISDVVRKWTEFETAMLNYCNAPEDFSWRKAMVQLFRNGEITDDEVALIDTFRRLRNEAVRTGKISRDISRKRLREIFAQVDKIMEKLQR